jgi:hypothetical protein
MTPALPTPTATDPTVVDQRDEDDFQRQQADADDEDDQWDRPRHPGHVPPLRSAATVRLGCNRGWIN